MKMLFGGILLAVGILIAGASGLCTLYFLSTSFTEPSRMISTIPVVLIFGLPPLAIGVGLVIGGRSLIREAREEGQEETDD